MFSLLLQTPYMLMAQNQISPDGNQLVSYHSEEGKGAQVYIQKFGKEKYFITNSVDHNYNPQWSSSRNKIVYYRKEIENPLTKLMLYDISSENESVVLNSGHYDGDPSISNDESKIAFTSNRDGNYDIYLVDLNATETFALVSNDANNYGPSWSPDDKQLVFTSDMNGNFELYTINSEGKKLRSLTEMGGENYKPDWSLDGKWISFFHRDTEDYEFDVFIVSPDDKEVRNISNTANESEFVCGWSKSELFFYVPTGIKAFDLDKNEFRMVSAD